MKAQRIFLLAAILAIASLVGASVTSAHMLVDPTTLTPPLKPFRICFQDGPWVKCDTSTPTANFENVAITDFDLPCGTIYQSGTSTTHATRWYKNLLLVERNAQEHIDGTWSLSPTGSAPTVAFTVDNSWHDTFTIPGDLSGDSIVEH